MREPGSPSHCFYANHLPVINFAPRKCSKKNRWYCCQTSFACKLQVLGQLLCSFLEELIRRAIIKCGEKNQVSLHKILYPAWTLLLVNYLIINYSVVTRTETNPKVRTEPGHSSTGCCASSYSPKKVSR